MLEVIRGDIMHLKGWSEWKARRLHMVVCLGLYCGLRRDELLHLHVSDLDIDKRLIRLVPHNKTGKLKTPGSEDTVPIPEALVPIIEEWLSHRLERGSGLRHPRGSPLAHTRLPATQRLDRWPRVGPAAVSARAGPGELPAIEYITIHMLRRSTATHLQPFASRSMVCRILRHGSEEVTEKFYLEADDAAMVSAVKDLVF